MTQFEPYHLLNHEWTRRGQAAIKLNPFLATKTPRHKEDKEEFLGQDNRIDRIRELNAELAENAEQRREEENVFGWADA